MVLIDSSVWIAAWRGAPDNVMGILSSLVESGEARLNPLIRAELLQGASDVRHQDTLGRLLDPIVVLPIPDNVWRGAPKLFLKCRKTGLTLTTIDCLLAAHAMSERTSLWSLDRIFEKIARHSPLKLFGG